MSLQSPRRVEKVLTPHMLIGLPSASRGVRFLLNFLPPEYHQHAYRKVQGGLNTPPLVGLLNFPARPLFPGGIFGVFDGLVSDKG